MPTEDGEFTRWERISDWFTRPSGAFLPCVNDATGIEDWPPAEATTYTLDFTWFRRGLKVTYSSRLRRKARRRRE